MFGKYCRIPLLEHVLIVCFFFLYSCPKNRWNMICVTKITVRVWTSKRTQWPSCGFFYHDRSYHIQGSENFRFGQYFWTPCCATKKLNHCSEIPKHALYLAQVSKGNSFFSRYSWKGNDHKDTGSLWGRKVRKWKILLFSIVFFFSFVHLWFF